MDPDPESASHVRVRIQGGHLKADPDPKHSHWSTLTSLIGSQLCSSPQESVAGSLVVSRKRKAWEGVPSSVGSKYFGAGRPLASRGSGSPPAGTTYTSHQCCGSGSDRCQNFLCNRSFNELYSGKKIIFDLKTRLNLKIELFRLKCHTSILKSKILNILRKCSKKFEACLLDPKRIRSWIRKGFGSGSEAN